MSTSTTTTTTTTTTTNPVSTDPGNTNPTLVWTPVFPYTPDTTQPAPTNHLTTLSTTVTAAPTPLTQADVSSTTQSLNALQTQVAAQQTTLTALQSNVTTNQNDITTLQGEASRITTNVSALQGTVNAIPSTYAAIQDVNNTLRPWFRQVQTTNVYIRNANFCEGHEVNNASVLALLNANWSTTRSPVLVLPGWTIEDSGGTNAVVGIMGIRNSSAWILLDPSTPQNVCLWLRRYTPNVTGEYARVTSDPCSIDPSKNWTFSVLWVCRNYNTPQILLRLAVLDAVSNTIIAQNTTTLPQNYPQQWTTLGLNFTCATTSVRFVIEHLADASGVQKQTDLFIAYATCTSA